MRNRTRKREADSVTRWGRVLDSPTRQVVAVQELRCAQIHAQGGALSLGEILQKANDFKTPLKFIVVGGTRKHGWRKLGQH